MTRIPASLLVALGAALSSTACVTVAGGHLPDITPEARRAGTLEYTVGDFEFTLDGGKMVTSNKAGRELQNALLDCWQEAGFIDSYSYVPRGQFSGEADYEVTLSGSQYGESSILLQIVSGLSLVVLPYYVDSKYDLQYVLKRRDGRQFSASASDSYMTWVSLLLIPVLPVSTLGSSATFEGMALHLYDQLASKGAFDPPTAVAPGSPGSPEEAP